MNNDMTVQIALLHRIGEVRRRLDQAEAELGVAKMKLEDTKEWDDWEEARDNRKSLKTLLDETVALTSGLAQLRMELDPRQMLTEVAEQINAGAMDSLGYKCTATVG